MKKATELTMRSKITVYWTTNPADLGYDGTPSYGEKGAWRNHDGKTMSLRKAAKYPDTLNKLIGQGVYRAICYKNKGREVAYNEIMDVITSREYEKSQNA